MKKNRHWALLSASLTLVLSACAVGDIYVRPNLAKSNVAAQWQAPTELLLPMDAAATQQKIDWWRQFNDVTLLQLQKAALAQNTTLAVSQAKMAQARANARAMGGNYLPSLNGAVKGTRSNYQSGTELLNNQGSIGLDASWELDLWGGNKATRQAATAGLEAAEMDYAVSHISVLSEVANAYIAYRGLQAQLNVLAGDIRSRQSSVRITGLLEKQGFIASADAALSEANLATAMQNELALQEQLDVLLKSITLLTASPEAQVRAWLAQNNGKHALIPQAPALGLARLPVQVVSMRPDVLAMERRLFAAHQQVTVAQVNRLPRLSLLGNIGVFGLRFSNGLPKQTGESWSFGASLTVPIFNAGKLEAAQESAQAQLAEAQAGYRAVVLNAVREIETALVQLDSSKQRMAQAQTVVQQLGKSLKGMQARYDAGMVSLLDLEESRRSHMAAQQAVLNLQQTYSTQWVTLYKATSGDWRNVPPTAVNDSAPSATANKPF